MDNDKLKLEIAEELGLMGKVRETGWKSLTAKESGRIGGLMAKRKKQAAVTPITTAPTAVTPVTIAQAAVAPEAEENDG